MQLFEIISVITYGLSKLIPKKKNRWIFGAWFGNAVSDNTKALYEYVKKNCPEIERIWISNDPSKVNLPGCIVSKRNSVDSLRYILTAKVAVMNQGFGDFAAYNFLGGAYKVQLWHGVAWKKIGKDAYPELKGVHERVFNLINHYDLYVAPSDEFGEILKKAFRANEDEIVYTGQPRNQSLLDENFCKESRDYLLKSIGEGDKKIVVYMPTFRDKTADVFSFCDAHIASQIGKLAEEHHFVLIEKAHVKSGNKDEVNLKDNHIYRMPTEDAQILLGGADILITDYSSCFFDFMVRDKPIIHYIYDFDYYKTKDRGVYYEVDDVACGSVVYNEEQLLGAIEDNLISDIEKNRRNKMRNKFVSYESPENCKIIIDAIAANIR